MGRRMKKGSGTCSCSSWAAAPSRMSSVIALSGSFSPVRETTSDTCRRRREPVASGCIDRPLLSDEKRLRTRPSTSPSSSRDFAVACTSAQTEGEH